MSLRSRLASFLRNLWRRDEVERDLDDELRSFLEMAIEEKRRSGLAPSEARRAALLEMGGLEQVKESVRDARTGAALEQIGGDVARAFRVLRRSPGFAAVAIAILALATGANTAVFSVVDTVVLRSPYEDPERLVKVCSIAPTNPERCEDLSLPDYADVRDQSHAFESIAADDWVGFTLADASGAREPVLGAMVTPAWLSTLGVRPILGRGFLPDEARPGGDRVVILTHDFWRRRFDSDPAVVGRTLLLDEQAFTVVGVLPRNVLRYGADFLKPLVPAEYYSSDRGFRDLDVVARLRPRVGAARAGAEMATIARRLAEDHPATNRGFGLRLVPLGRTYAGPGASARVDRSLLLMLGAVGLVLLLACVNVATLLLARAATRRREYVVRAALGAGRGRLVRQLLVENLLLFLCGGAAGVILARGCLALLVRVAVAGALVPERMTVALDGRVLLFCLTLSLLTGLIFGLAPALHASRLDLNDALKSGSQGAPPGRARTRRALVVCELALATVLLVGLGLLVRSFWNLQAVAPGFDVERLLVTDYHTPFARPAGFWRDALGRIRALPGVESAAVTSRPPLLGARTIAFELDGDAPRPAAERPTAVDVFVSPDYFGVMGIPLLRGRAFDERDSGPAVAVVSRNVARRLLAGESPLGRRLRLGDAPEVSWQVIGEVGDVTQRHLDEPRPMSLYRPWSESAEQFMFVVVRARSDRDATRLAASLGAHLAGTAPGAEWPAFRTMREIVSRSDSLELRRFALIPLGVLTCLAVLLAVLGVYGVTSCAVAERVREIGIRVALGATRRRVLGGVLGEAVALAAAGLGAGVAVAAGAMRLLSALLFGVAPTDATTHLAVAALLGVLALLAGTLPARRAVHVDPVEALRCE